MKDKRPFIDSYDTQSAEDRSAGCGSSDGEYVPGRARRGMSLDGEYRSRRTRDNLITDSSPSPASEDGDDGFDVFNFEAARRRKQEREDRLNAQIAQQEAPRRVVDRIAAEERPRRRTERSSAASKDNVAQKAAGFVGKLATYTAPLKESAGRRDSRTQADRRPAAGTTRSRSSAGTGRGNTSSRRKTASASSRNSTGIIGRIREIFSDLPTAGKAVVITGCVLLALVIVYNSVFGILLADMNSLELTRRDNTPASEVSSLELMSRSGVTNILLLGIDDDGSSGSRSDTIMIASVDSRSGNIRLCSILRDCYVEIPGYRASRINSAYAHGGAQLAVQTVENNFRVKIDHCVTIDMAALVDVVDAVGGVEIELTAAEAKQVNLHSHCGLTTSAGKQLLNGKQAVTYAQIRKIDSDFKRTQRQRTLINAIITKVRSLGVGDLLGLVKAVAPNISTDMSSSQIGELALKALPALSGELGQMTVPADGKYSSTTINGMSVLDLDLEANAKLLQSYLFGD